MVRLTPLILFIVILAQCNRYDAGPGYVGNEVINDTLLTGTYPELYEAVFARDELRIRPYLDHKLIEVRKQAWRALTQTPIDSLDWYIEQAKKGRLEVSWFALSLHPYSSGQLRNLEVYWDQNPDRRGGVSLVLGRQGDEPTLHFLVDRLEEAAGRSYEFQYALAVGRLMQEYDLQTGEHLRLIETAFHSDQSMITRAYLYGYYRGESLILTEEFKKKLYDLWIGYGLGSSSLVDQYVAKILQGRVFNEIIGFYSEEGLLAPNVQLGVELARVAGDIELDPESIRSIEVLLGQDNPHVLQQSLESLEGRLRPDSQLFQKIENEFVNGSDQSPFVWLQAVKTLTPGGGIEAGLNRERLERIMQVHPYLMPDVLEIYRETDSADRFLDRISVIVNEDHTLRTMFAFQALTGFWNGLDKKMKTPARAERVRTLVFEGLNRGDRGVAYTLLSLLSEESLFDESDFPRINRALGAFELPEDIEVYQVFGQLFQRRFRERARPVIDSLASLGYAPLNRSFAEQGWDVNVPGESSTEFRTPDWERLWSLGVEPIWVLQTEKGEIKIQMNLLSAPATVSAIDSLTRSGAYNGIPFHRVVPNFVIQGGDVERADGFGGPDFVLPTEASETGYYRGAVGIASAGTDTEGSQYFIMHQWKPHLNGRYTLFGTVVDGMKVVDQIAVGDTVRNVYWE